MYKTDRSRTGHSILHAKIRLSEAVLVLSEAVLNAVVLVIDRLFG